MTANHPHALPEQTSSKVTVREAVLQLLRHFNMHLVFGNPGSTELPLFRDFPSDFRYVLGLQESVVVGMADGYAQASGNAAFVNLHSAAGVGHAMGNIFTAYKNNTPMVITAGQQARSILPFDPFLHSAQATELPKPYVKWSCEPARAEDVPLAIARAYYLAMQEPRGPVFVSIPADDWDRTTDLVSPRAIGTASLPDPRILAEIAQALNGSERPAFVVGAGVDRSNAWKEIVELAERHKARVYVAPMSARCSFPEDHRLFGGFLPAMREKLVERLAGHDIILVLGAPAFSYHVEGAGNHVPPGATLYQIIDDPATAAWTPTGTAATGNVRLAVQHLLEKSAPRQRSLPPERDGIPRVAPPSADEHMSVAYVMQTLSELRQPSDIVVEEAPSSRPVIQKYLPMVKSGTFFTMSSGGLGYGLPAAIGVAMAKPQEKVIAMIGDGSSMYAIQALWSAAQLKLPITFLILKNQRYAALQDFASVFGFEPGASVEGTELPDIDFVSLAQGQGCAAVRVEQADDLHEALLSALRSPVPTLVEIEVA
ncbi:MAG TPA: benzoylformate decarboxylase [Sphingomicrobium sp.]|nr:benzoylformate decarboxylase [Sphingomicrobium sp.]